VGEEREKGVDMVTKNKRRKKIAASRGRPEVMKKLRQDRKARDIRAMGQGRGRRTDFKQRERLGTKGFVTEPSGKPPMKGLVGEGEKRGAGWLLQ